MQAHLFPLGCGQRPRLLPHGVRDSDVTHIVEVGSDAELGDRLPVQSHLGRCREREPGDLRRMAMGVRGLDVGQVTEGGRHRCQVGVVDLHGRSGLSLEDSRPRISAAASASICGVLAVNTATT